MATPSADELKVELIAEEKYHEERIAHVERNFAALSTAMCGIARKTALMRDKGDKLSKMIRDMSYGETGGLKSALENLSECFRAMEDYRQTELDRLEAKIVKPLLDYENTCRKAKDELRGCYGDRSKVINQQRSLDKTRIREPTNRRKIVQLETDLQKAKFKRLQSTKMLDDHMQGFERKRVHDLKISLKEFVNTEMIFHAKALELLTLAYQTIDNIDESETVQAFLNNLQVRKRRSIFEEPTHNTPTSLPSTPSQQRTNSEPSLISAQP